MIDIGNCYFVCDECPIGEGVEYRLRIAKEGGYAPQFEYCGCDKVQLYFLLGGCCEDAYVDKPHRQKKGKRKSGMEYRRIMRIKHRDGRMQIVNRRRYNPLAGYVDGYWADGKWQPVGKYVKYPKNSNNQRYWKRYSNKIVRRSKEVYRGNRYRKCFDYRWELY